MGTSIAPGVATVSLLVENFDWLADRRRAGSLGSSEWTYVKVGQRCRRCVRRCHQARRYPHDRVFASV